MSDKVTIRAATEDHVHILNYLHREVFTDGETVPDFTKGHWWVVYQWTIPVGFCGMIQSYSWTDAGYLIRVGVLPLARGQGLQKKLIRLREKKARSLGWAWMISDTIYQNTPSNNSLISCGYRMFEPDQPWALDDSIYWKKEL